MGCWGFSDCEEDAGVEEEGCHCFLIFSSCLYSGGLCQMMEWSMVFYEHLQLVHAGAFAVSILRHGLGRNRALFPQTYSAFIVRSFGLFHAEEDYGR